MNSVFVVCRSLQELRESSWYLELTLCLFFERTS